MRWVRRHTLMAGVLLGALVAELHDRKKGGAK